MQSIRLANVRAARTVVLPQRRLLATPPNRPPIGVPPVAPPVSGAVPVRPVVVTSVPLTPGSSTLVDADLASSEIPPPPPPPPPKQPRRLFRKFLIYTTVGILTFYPLSGFLSTKNETYREFFTSSLPFGEAVADYADEHRWESFGVGSVSQKAVKGWQRVTGEEPKTTGQRVEDKAKDVKSGVESKAAQIKREAEVRASQAKADLSRGVNKVENKVESAAERAKAEAKETADKAKAGLKSAAQKAEAAGHEAKLQAEAAAAKVKSGVKDAKAKVEAVGHDAKVQAEAAAKKAQAEAGSLKDRVVHATQDAADKAAALAKEAKDKVVAATSSIPFNAGDGLDGIVREAESALNKGEAKIANAVNKGEAKIANAINSAERTVENASLAPPSSVYPDTQRPRELRPETVTPAKPTFDGQSKYAGPPLPLGFEPPPGYYIPPPAKPAAEPAAPTLPLLAPKVQDFGTDEPIISQLASTIDSLTTSLSAPGSGPSTDATGILSKAQDDLTALSKRLSDIKRAEKEKLERSLGDKTKEFEATLKKVEAGRDAAEVGIKQQWEKERAGLVADWKRDMDKELESQREGIEKRLREEVVSQGIELQRRWLRSIKTQVETERGGRLAKLDDLTSSLKELKNITLDNSATLDQNVRVHKVWSALRAVQAKTESGDLSFDDELRVLRSLNSTDTQSATVASAALDQLDASGIASTGVKSLAALSSWFTTSVSPRVQSAALVPSPENAGVASHLASLTLSRLMFRPTPGPVDGEDVSAVLARAEWCLAEKDLDGAAREVNRLQGWPKRLASDWLREARRALEVRQALEVVATDATLGSLLLV